ncbi:MAG: DsbA family protein, partial [Pseudomonadota bacterium]
TAPEALDAFLDRVYPPFWQRDLDIEDLALVTQTLRAADVETAGFAAYATGVGREQHDIEQTAIFDAGIYGVPTYVHGGEFWFGRENLAVLRHRLLGNPGPAPDVRYDRLSGNDVETPTLAAQLKPVERIDIYIDLLEAPSYLGLAATIAMLEVTGRRARWLPFRGPAPTARPKESEATADSTVRGVAHRRHRSRYRVASLEAQAAALGCSIERRYSPTSAALFDDALLWVDDQPDAPAVEPFIAACFNAYWEHNADITDADMIRTELIAAGFDGNAWAARLRDGQLDTAAVARIDAALANAEERGTWEGPRFILDDEPYSGRTHLPLVEARLRLVQSETPTQ